MLRSLPLLVGAWACTDPHASMRTEGAPATAATAPPRTQATAASSVPATLPPMPETPPVNLALTRSARLLAGRDGDAASPDAKRTADELARFDKHVADPLRAWSEHALPSGEGTVLYPFSGPDFITARRLYPRADRYVLVALQDGGEPVDLGALADADRDALVRTTSEAILDFAHRGFFVTKAMGSGFAGASGSHGIAAVLMAFLAHERLEIVEAEPIRLGERDVEVVPRRDHDSAVWTSLRFLARSEDDAKPVTIDYVRLDLGNGWLGKHPKDLAWLRHVAKDHVILKATAHMPQQAEFSLFKAAMLDVPREIVEDETGIAYDALVTRFDVTLYGRFAHVNPLFDDGPQRGLARAYEAAPDTEPLPFLLGYAKRAGSCLQVARRRL